MSPRLLSLCAQRLSASRNFAEKDDAQAATDLSGAQRLSASRSFAGDDRHRDRLAVPVLNAFRHHGVLRTQGYHWRAAGEKCSTPCGITEFCGRAISTGITRPTCAQRLSASRSLCGNRMPAVRLRVVQVLNAFRHHGVSRGERGTIARLSIVVLNAFRHHGVSRLSKCGHGLYPGFVLNAFRHHGVSRPERPDLAAGDSVVLNAFRHHGISRSIHGEQFGPSLWCSTPFGITEFRGSRRPIACRPCRCAQRLSASRSFAGLGSRE